MTPYSDKFGNGHSKKKIGSQPHTFEEYKTQRRTLKLKRARSIPRKKLRENKFNNICSQLSTNPKIDLFATKLNTQLSTFALYRPDPKCIAVNAFLLD